MTLVENQMGDTQLYPDGPGATLETPKKTSVEGDACEAAETQKVPDTPALVEAVSEAEDGQTGVADQLASLSLQQNQLPKKRLPNPLLHQLVHLNLVVQPMRRSWRLFRLNDLIGAP